jgi:hypothetical protein
VILIRPEFGEVVAKTTFLFQWPNAEEKSVRIKLGRPYIEENEGRVNWACPCELEGLERELDDADMASYLGAFERD